MQLAFQIALITQFTQLFLFLRWESETSVTLANETTDVTVSHDVTNYEFFYEPFYVAKDDAPPHDERFVG